ncbi:MAG: 2,3-bisphosphoglycerate-dependent phosphoglycerate mutase [Chlamydiales bacterium]|nr:2,3-bisphosphoglycerate-dependent phosphoglycerate mutase [Chlamydiales bacterium]MCH9619428.1 2,3-bisphosphoglycerate-dependent phosphoglycerate mutase [Chlamydiales bacterium]MCH9622232.1 2,3-bisphosphoglycerate-dependent phosphoglycerate mutase [Chlamydiales bacterium]
MSKLILLRHGQSEWNKKNIFTGWVDIPLSPKGIEEALLAGEKIKSIPIDQIYLSTLFRASMTAMLAMSVHTSGRVPAIVHKEAWYAIPEGAELIPTIVSEALNERMYGDLQGKNKQKIKEEFGEEQFIKWRRSFANPPPNGESLKMTAARTLPYFDNEIVPQLKAGKNILISAHGNSLRSIVMELDGLSEEEVISLEIPTGVPLFYTYEKGCFTK